jgi:trans-2,3-dihydro-3-hydroxyanthranilate isomerase
MSLSYLQYDVFTNEPLTGNQLAVFTDARALETAQMQRIAREMNFSESTFILPADAPGIDIRMRIYTPGSEMPMAGHPTIGSTFALAHTGVIPRDAARVTFGLNIGPVPVDLEWNTDGLSFAWMTQALPTFGRVLDDPALVAGAIGLQPRDLSPDLPAQEVSCGVPYLCVPLRDKDCVDAAVSDAAAFRRLWAATGTTLPVFRFALAPAGSADTVYSRMFAPGIGIVEDPATGSASGPLGCYLVHHGVVAGERALRIVSRQGVAMGRPSLVHVQILAGDAGITQVRVGGVAVLVGRGELFV